MNTRKRICTGLCSIGPNDEAIASRYRDVVALRRRGELSLPSSIGAERRINLFLQAESAEQLAELRHHKDHWRAP